MDDVFDNSIFFLILHKISYFFVSKYIFVYYTNHKYLFKAIEIKI